MPFIGFMHLLTLNYPIRVVGKEGIGLLGCIINFRQTQAISQRKGLPIDTGATNDVNFLIGLTSCKGSSKRGESLSPGKLLLATRQHDIPTIRQRALRQ